MSSSKCIIKNIAQMVMSIIGFGCRFHDLNILKLDFLFFIFHDFVINSRASLQNFLENIKLIFFFTFYTISKKTCVQYTYLHTICINFKIYVHFFLKIICQHKLLDFVGQCVIQMFNFSFTNSKLVYSFESLSLEPM